MTRASASIFSPRIAGSSRRRCPYLIVDIESSLCRTDDGPDLAEDVNDDDDDSSKLGLLGLAGLKKKPDVHVHTDRDPVRNPRP